MAARAVQRGSEGTLAPGPQDLPGSFLLVLIIQQAGCLNLGSLNIGKAFRSSFPDMPEGRVPSQ